MNNFVEFVAGRAPLVAQPGENPPANAGDVGSVPGWGDPLEKGMATHSSILPKSISMDGGAWWATVHGVAKSWT